MRIENGFYWPEEDSGMRAVAFGLLPDLEKAISYVTDFTCCVQAGGNVGVWPKELLKHFGYVYTFEPDLTNFEYLCKNLPEHRAYKFPCGLGNGGIGTLIPNKTNIGAGKMIRGGFTPVLRIDDLSLEACGFIQLDIEGMELEALKGARLTIQKFKPVLMIEEKGLGNSVLPFLEKIGYQVRQQVHKDLICTI